MNNVNQEFVRWMPVIFLLCWASWTLRGLYDQFVAEWRPRDLQELHPEKDTRYMVLSGLIRPARRTGLTE